MSHIGIDLGTTYSLVGQVNAQAVPSLFGDVKKPGEFRTPSVVHIGDEGALVGQVVEQALLDDPSMPHSRFAKLAIGSAENVFRDYLDRAWSPEALSSLILRKLVQDAKANINDDIESALIAVPAQFGDAQRRATKAAAIMAGLPRVQLIEEPVAAASFYGLSSSQEEQTLFVYDLGGGTFDATILHCGPEGLYVLATAGRNDVGGKFFDEKIMQAIAVEFKRQCGFDPMTSAVASIELRRAAEQIKIELSNPGKGQVRKSLLIAGRTVDFALTRSQFERMIKPLVEATIAVCEECLSGAALNWQSMDRLLLTGGSSLLPPAQSLIRRVSNMASDKVICQKPHQAIAYGAIALAAGLAGQFEGPSLQQSIATKDLGLRVKDRKSGGLGMKVLIPRNSPLPASCSSTFYTTREDQSRMIIELVQSSGEGAISSLGSFAFGPIESPRKNKAIEITVSYDLEGLVRVSAVDSESQHEMERILEDQGQGELGQYLKHRDLVASIAVNP